jgi:Icc protein
VSRPFLLAQLSDPHVGADWGSGESTPRLRAAVEAVAASRPRPDAVLLSGDVADHAGDDEYRDALELLAALDVPIFALPGNHDRRAPLRRHFDLPGSDDDPVQYAAEAGPLRLVVLDSMLPDEDGGALGDERLQWLERELAAAPEQPTLIAMHHPPLVTGLPAMDEIGLADEDRRALARVVGRHPQVRRILGGHLHCAITGELAGRPVMVAPSIYDEVRPDFSTGSWTWLATPPGFALHAALNGELTSHVVRVPA